LNKAGSGYTLKATSSTLAPATTGQITVTPAPATQLVILPGGEPPSSLTAGVPFSMVVEAEDQFGNLDTNFNGQVAITRPTNIMGTITATATNGVARFSNLLLDTVGTYQLQASSSQLSSAQSISVTVGPNRQIGIVRWTEEPPSLIQRGTGFAARLEV